MNNFLVYFKQTNRQKLVGGDNHFEWKKATLLFLDCGSILKSWKTET